MVADGRKEQGPKSAPYPPGNSVEQFFERMQKAAKPAKVDVPLLRTYNIAPKNEAKVLRALMFLGLINEQGEPTSKFQDVQVTGEQFRTNLKAIVEKAYEGIFDAYGQIPDSWEDLENYFRINYPPPSVARNSARFFARMCSDAGLELPPQIAERVSRGGRPPQAGKRKKGKEERKKVSKKTRREAVGDILDKLPQVIIDSTWDAEKINLVFDRMEKLVEQIGRITAGSA